MSAAETAHSAMFLWPGAMLSAMHTSKVLLGGRAQGEGFAVVRLDQCLHGIGHRQAVGVREGSALH